MKTRYIIIALISAAAVSTASAQDQNPASPNLDRQVEVLREYTPDLERSIKLQILPDMVDTVAIRPDFSYTVRPSAWVTGFGVAAISPARIESESPDRIKPFYLKAGGGYPGQSTADLYLNTIGSGVSSAGLALNHYGRYPDIKNDLGVKQRALQSSNRAVLFGKVGFGRYTFGGEAGVDYSIWSRYGQFAMEEHPLTVYGPRSPLQSYTTPFASLYLGTDFTDLSSFNFRVGGAFYNIADRYDNSETGYSVFAEIGKMFSGHRLGLRADFSGRNGRDNLSASGNRILDARVKYGIRTGVVNLDVSLGIGYDMPRDDIAVWETPDVVRIDRNENKVWFLPALDFSADFTDGVFVPFATLGSELRDNGFRSLSMANPYIDPEITPLRSSTVYQARAGFAGSFVSVFSYSLYAGYDIARHLPYFVNIYREGNTTSFDALPESRINTFSLGAEFAARLNIGLSATLSGRYMDHSAKTYKHAYGMPGFEGSFRIDYAHRNLFRVGAGVDLTGKRWFRERFEAGSGFQTTYEFYDRRQKSVFSLNIDAEYSINSNLGVFIEGRNLTGNKLYIFNHYPDQGVSVTAGVKLVF